MDYTSPNGYNTHASRRLDCNRRFDHLANAAPLRHNGLKVCLIACQHRHRSPAFSRPSSHDHQVFSGADVDVDARADVTLYMGVSLERTTRELFVFMTRVLTLPATDFTCKRMNRFRCARARANDT